MTILEKKVDALARSVLANDLTDRNAAVAELAVLMQKPRGCAEGADAVARDLLIELGVPEHILGSRYLILAICEVVEDQNKIKAITSYLYPTIAEIYSTTGSRVERAIRHGIELAWDRGNLGVLQRHFGYSVSAAKGRPTNSEFIARAASIVRARIGGGITRVLQNMHQLRCLPRSL